MALSQRAAHRKDVGKIADMQHRHFATIATIIRGLDLSGYEASSGIVRADIAKQFADRLCATNPNFDADRFMRAACD